jgi:hypothetical protein
MAGWVGEWLERFEYGYKYMKDTSRMKRPPSEYFARNIWVSGDPEERMLPFMVQFGGDDKFFIGSDYPHAEGFLIRCAQPASDSLHCNQSRWTKFSASMPANSSAYPRPMGLWANSRIVNGDTIVFWCS